MTVFGSGGEKTILIATLFSFRHGVDAIRGPDSRIPPTHGTLLWARPVRSVGVELDRVVIRVFDVVYQASGMTGTPYRMAGKLLPTV